MRVTLERNDRSLISFGSNHVLDEGSRGGFFIRQRALFRNAHADQKRNRQRSLCFTLKSEERLWHAVFQHADVVLLERRDVAIVLVGGGEKKIREIRFCFDYVNILRRERRGILRRSVGEYTAEESIEN